MTPLLAAKKPARSVSPTAVDCDVRSDSVRAINVTLRLTATPDENSTVPKNITSMTGTMTANSVAAIPLRSLSILAAARRMRSQIGSIDIDFIALSRQQGAVARKGSLRNAAVADNNRLLPARFEM